MSNKSDFLYYKIYSDIIARIKEGSLSAGEKIEKETELAEKYSVSRATMRKALDYLCRMNLIYRIKKGGTFINGKLNFSSQQKIVPIVLPFTENLHRELVTGIQSTALTLNTFSPVYDSFSAYKNERDILESIYRMGVDGLIIYPCAGINNLDWLYKFKTRGIPVVFIDRRTPGINFPLVTSNNRQGMALATEHLIALGHEKIAFFAMTQNMIVTEQDRLTGYLETLSNHNIPIRSEFIFSLEMLADRLVRLTPKQQTSYYNYIFKKKALKIFNPPHGQDRPTAIVFINDCLAINFMRLTAEMKDVSLPDDISITGFDNVAEGERSVPALTTIRQNFFRIGQKAMETMTMLMQGEYVPPNNYIDTDLILRRSTALRK